MQGPAVRGPALVAGWLLNVTGYAGHPVRCLMQPFQHVRDSGHESFLR
jgi:hypothetical protein